MIFCIANKEPWDYTSGYGDGGSGLWETYNYNLALFGLICLGTFIPFEYEPGMEELPLGQRIVVLDRGPLIEKTLKQKIDRVPVNELVETMLPTEFLHIINTKKIDHLHILGVYQGKVETFRYVVRMRVLQWRHHFRGKIKDSNGVATVRFKSDLSAEEQAYLNTGVNIYKSKRLQMAGGPV